MHHHQEIITRLKTEMFKPEKMMIF